MQSEPIQQGVYMDYNEYYVDSYEASIMDRNISEEPSEVRLGRGGRTLESVPMLSSCRPHLQHSPRVTAFTGRIRSMVSRFRLLSLPPRKLILEALLIRLKPRSP
jgi:hypothetical protein